MRDEASFWRALAASPGDDGLRLAFADWLEERGDARAPWVRDPDVFKWIGPDGASPIPALVKALLGRSREKIEASRALRRIGGPAIPALLDAAAGASEGAFHLLLVTFQAAGNKIAALEELLRGAASRNRQVRWVALEGLASLSNDSPRALAAVAGALDREAVPEIVLSALSRLSQLDRVSPELVPPLARLFDRWPSNDSLLYQASAALGKVGPAAAPGIPALLRHMIRTDSFLAAHALGAIGEAAVGPILDAVPRLSGALRPRALEAITKVGRAAIPELRAAAAGADAALASFARDALASIGPDPESMPELLAALRGRDPVLWTRALRSLAAMGPAAAQALPAVVDVLLRARQGELEFWEVSGVLNGLGPAARAELPRIRQALRGPVPDAQWQMAIYLTEAGLGATAALDLLDEGLKNGDFPTDQPNSGLRTTAYYSSSRPSLRGAWCLGAILQELTPGARPAPAELADVVSVALRPPAEALPALRRALKHRALAVRLAACLGLHHAGTAETVEALREALADRNRVVRGQAVRTLASLGAAAPGVVVALAGARKARAKEVRQAAEEELRRWG